MMKARTIVRNGSLALRRGLDLLGERIYPPSCLACKAAVDAPGTLCSSCWVRMPFIERPFCERLGTPFPQDLGAGLISPAALADPPVFARARAVALYNEGPARQLVQRLKYADRLDLAPAMSRWMARAGAELIAEADMVVPVPLHRWRLWSRRFNQAAVLAMGLAREAGLPFEPLALVRVKATRPQVGLSREARAQNVQGAFRVTPEGAARLAGSRVLLVDDVLTSGATLNAAARVLLRAGAARVDVVTFARVVTGQ
jgi:ComF family protein